jgi:hypothetical protein
MRPSSFIVSPLGSSRWVVTPMARSACPVTSASHVPARTSVRMRSRVGVAIAAMSLAGAREREDVVAAIVVVSA